MQRLEKETFEEYKLRRAASNKLRSLINYKTKHQRGIPNSRTQLRSNQKGGGTYGLNLRAAFDSRRPDLAQRQKRHAEYLLAKQVKRSAKKEQLLKAA